MPNRKRTFPGRKVEKGRPRSRHAPQAPVIIPGADVSCAERTRAAATNAELLIGPESAPKKPKQLSARSAPMPQPSSTRAVLSIAE